MSLERSSIEREFPLRRRGYDPDAVAAHLASLADAVEALRRSAGPTRPEGLSGAASEQVRSILEAAEASAAALVAEAESERTRVLEQARREAQALVERVAVSTAAMLERADVLEAGFDDLLLCVRTRATRLTDELGGLETAVDELRGASAHEPGRELEPEPVEEPEPELATAPPVDDAGARLVALNMALSGSTREETGRYLADHFDRPDLDGLLDVVYARAGQ